MRIVGGGDDDNQSGIGWHPRLTKVDEYQILNDIIKYCVAPCNTVKVFQSIGSQGGDNG